MINVAADRVRGTDAAEAEVGALRWPLRRKLDDPEDGSGGAGARGRLWLRSEGWSEEGTANAEEVPRQPASTHVADARSNMVRQWQLRTDTNPLATKGGLAIRPIKACPATVTSVGARASCAPSNQACCGNGLNWLESQKHDNTAGRTSI